MTRLVLALLVVFVAGCGPLRPVLTPSLASVPRLSPDLVPAQGGSSVVVTGRSGAAGVSGRALDRDTGAPLAGLLVRAGDETAVTDADGAFALSSAGARLTGSYPGYLSFDDVLGGDGAAPSASSVLILLVRDPALVETTGQGAR